MDVFSIATLCELIRLLAQYKSTKGTRAVSLRAQTDQEASGNRRRKSTSGVYRKHQFSLSLKPAYSSLPDCSRCSCRPCLIFILLERTKRRILGVYTATAASKPSNFFHKCLIHYVNCNKVSVYRMLTRKEAHLTRTVRLLRHTLWIGD